MEQSTIFIILGIFECNTKGEKKFIDTVLCIENIPSDPADTFNLMQKLKSNEEGKQNESLSKKRTKSWVEVDILSIYYLNFQKKGTKMFFKKILLWRKKEKVIEITRTKCSNQDCPTVKNNCSYWKEASKNIQHCDRCGHKLEKQVIYITKRKIKCHGNTYSYEGALDKDIKHYCPDCGRQITLADFQK